MGRLVCYLYYSKGFLLSRGYNLDRFYPIVFSVESLMSLLKKVCNPFESGTPRIIFMLFRWFNPVKCMKFNIFVGRQHNHFQEVDLISVDSLMVFS